MCVYSSRSNLIAVVRKNVIRPQAGISSNQYSWFEPGENLLNSDSAGGWQRMWLNFPSPYWFSTDSLASAFHREPSASIGRKNPESIQAADGPFARNPEGSAEESP
jgi:hypothetical protein